MPPAPAATALLRRADAADHALVLGMLSALLDGLDPAHSPQGEAMRAALGPDLQAAWQSPRVCILVASVEGAAVGLGRADVLQEEPLFRLRRPRHCGYIDQMFVLPPWRRRGLGRRLLAALEGWLAGEGVDHVLLHAAPGATPFYQPAGYSMHRQMIKRL